MSSHPINSANDPQTDANLIDASLDFLKIGAAARVKATPSEAPAPRIEPNGEFVHPASAYIVSLFEPDDLIAVAMKKGDGQFIHQFGLAKEVAANLAPLQQKNEEGYDIWMCMNPLKAKRRVKTNVDCIRTAYLDLDVDGQVALDKIFKSTQVPKPSFVLATSPGKFQVIWCVEGMTPQEQEALLHVLIQGFGGDPAASDMVRVLRLPGFINHKYPSKPVVQIVENNFEGKYTLADFKIDANPVSIAEKTSFVAAAEVFEGEGRNIEMLRAASSMRAKGFVDEAVRTGIAAQNQVVCRPPLDADELDSVVKSALRDEYKQRDAERRKKQKTDAASDSAYGVPPAELQNSYSDSENSPPVSTIMSVYACDVVLRPIEYLWEPYLQTNAVNAYYGNPGGGKGFTGVDNIACLTTARPFPTETITDRKPMNAVILDAEQGMHDTLVPRLKAAGADLKKVRIITTVRVHEKDDSFSERMITFQEDMAAVKADLQQHPEEKFLFIDPITNYVGDINFNQDGEVRPVLTMLVHLAEELKITIVIVGHFNKNSNVSTALDKPGGCRAWTAVPRAVWGFFRQSDNNQQRVMVNLKLNNAKEVDTGLLFTIEGQNIGTKPDGTPWVVGHIVWGERTDATADDLVAADRPESRRDTKGVDFINEALKEGRAPATMVYERAESKHISESTLKRACASVEVLKYKMPGVGWFWQHPTDRTPIPEAAKELNQEARVRREQQGAGATAIIDGESVEEPF